VKKTTLLSIVIVLGASFALLSCQTETPPDPAELSAEVNRLADLYVDRSMARMPEMGYMMGFPPERHDGLLDNSPEAYERARREDDEMLAALDPIDHTVLEGSPEWVTYGMLLEALEASRDVRICREELWNVSHMNGWQAWYPILAGMQPVGTPELREQALARWRKFPTVVDYDIANLKKGLAEGYTANRAVVQRVIQQVDGLLAIPADQSPFMSPVLRDQTPEFAGDFMTLVTDEILPAIGRYRDFLKETYVEGARESLAVSDNPDGLACYNAMLRSHTSLPRTAEQVFELGKSTVEKNALEIIETGKQRYGTDDFAEIIRLTKADPADRFADADELLAFSRDAVERSTAVIDEYFGLKPGRECVVEPYPAYQEGTGVSARYEAGSGDRPGTYRIPLFQPETLSRGNIELTAFHETNPGHHLQISIAQNLEGAHRIGKMAGNGGYIEGWARYAEALAEEVGLCETPTVQILRRAWPARGMVVDPGIHVFGWTREEAKEFMLVSGRFPAEQGDDMVDRIASSPGQLTSYDSGGLEIFALRRQAEEALGDAFDIREFHDRVLEHGAVPLWMLRQHVEAWIASEISR
jgi:uncharacterized protein (DUF885 family)